MSGPELVSTITLVIALIGLGLYFGVRQIRTWRRMKQDQSLPPLERVYLQKQVQRRFICSALMLVFAGFLIGWFFLYRELQAVETPDPEQRAEHPLVRTLVYYWMAALFILFSLLVLACLDLIATARHAFRSSRQLDLQKRAEIEADLARYRRERAERN